MRSTVAAILAAAALALIGGTPAAAAQRTECADARTQPTRDNLDAVRAAVLCLHNRERAEHGLPLLKENGRLRRAASGHSDHMVRASFFGHEAPSGRDMVERIRDAGYRGATLGENIAWGTGELATALEIHRAWMASGGHRANILRREFRDIGIGIALGAAGAGGDGATYTADFGRRR